MENKKMGVMQLTIITAINMMGSGIIMLPANLAQVGTISILSWLVTAIGAMFIAYGFSQAGMFTRKGGGMGGLAEYSYGKAGAFMANYNYGISCLVTNVAIATSVVGYLDALFKWNQTPIEIVLTIILILVLSTILNFGGAGITGRISNFTILGILVPVGVIIFGGWFWFHPAMYVAAWNPHHYGLFSGLGKSISITLWAFLGLESAAVNMDKVENPKKNLPIAVLGGTIGAAILYILSTNIVQGIVPNLDLASSTAPFGLVFAHMFNPTIGSIVIGLMIISCFGSLTTWQFTQAELFRSSAQEGYYPNIFKKVTSHEVPIMGMIIALIIEAVMAFSSISPNLSAQFTLLVNLAVITNVIPYILSMGSLRTMQQIDGTSSPKKQSRNTVVAFVAGVYSVYAITQAGTQAIVMSAVVILFGWTLYGLMSPKFDVPKSVMVLEKTK
ncbi:MAG: putrescine-ornithine antiporter [Streptococcaceae bacterium]|jgi:putrescine:ornithine antiporter|nr:putrescine-ornithine antiporter [Streptococcaceae bacterium]